MGRKGGLCSLSLILPSGSAVTWNLKFRLKSYPSQRLSPPFPKEKAAGLGAGGLHPRKQLGWDSLREPRKGVKGEGPQLYPALFPLDPVSQALRLCQPSGEGTFVWKSRLRRRAGRASG